MTSASTTGSPTCRISEVTLGRTMRALRIENDLLAATVLLDKGADIYALVYKPLNLDVLWKSPWGLKEPARGFDSAFDSSTAWLEAYAGGWQLLIPNGGAPCTYKGASLGFHGEASMVAWDFEILRSDNSAAEVRLSTRLVRSPFRLERILRVDAGKPVLVLREKVVNEAGEAMDFMWSHHPAFGAPFLSDQCRVDTGAKTLLSDDSYVGTVNPLALNTRYSWPMVDGTDMSAVPGPNASRDTLGYLKDFDEAWYGITNTEMGLGVGLVWDKSIFPYAWFWQEMNASSGFPFYKNSYVMAIEPASSIPGQGLTLVMDTTKTHLTLAAGASAEMEMRAAFYNSHTGIQKMETDGTVILR